MVKKYREEIENGEPALQLGRILDSMKPPVCWGLGEEQPSSALKESPRASFTSPILLEPVANGCKDDPYDVSRFLQGLPALQSLLAENSSKTTLLKNNLNSLVSIIPNSALHQFQEEEKRKGIIRSVYKAWAIVKVRLSCILNHK